MSAVTDRLHREAQRRLAQRRSNRRANAAAQNLALTGFAVAPGTKPRLSQAWRALESQVEAKACDGLHQLGLRTLKLNVQANTGWPDRLVFIPGGRPLFIEFKRAGETLRPKQQHIHKVLTDLGFNVQTHDSAAGAVAAAKQALTESRKIAKPWGKLVTKGMSPAQARKTKNAWTREWYRFNKEKQHRMTKTSNLKRLYGLTYAQYEAMLFSQDFLCAICRVEHQAGTQDALHVDHDHKTKKVRGLLCNRCNRWLGLVEAYPDFFEAAKTYLRSASSGQLGSPPVYEKGGEVPRRARRRGAAAGPGTSQD